MLHTFVIRIRGGPADTLPGGSAVMCESLSSLPQPSLGAIKSASCQACGLEVLFLNFSGMCDDNNMYL